MPNGYNEEIFAEIESSTSYVPPVTSKKRSGTVILVHSGVIYPNERDPAHFFEALSALKKQGLIDTKRLKIILRATGHDSLFRPEIERLAIDDIVQLVPGIPYREALKEMLGADGLIIFQAANCNHQVPAKIYEYFRARRPVLALTDQEGDTAKTLVCAGLNDIAPLNDSLAIQKTLVDFLAKIESGTASVAREAAIRQHSRQSAAEKLAELFNAIAG